MERRASIEEAQEIFGKNFIGPAELNKYSVQMGIMMPPVLPEITYTLEELKTHSEDYLLVLGTSRMSSGDPLTLLSLRNHFGINPDRSEPCFYNQDWYLKETFMNTPFSDKWYLVRRFVFEESRAKSPELIENAYHLPLAVQCAYVFFINYFCTGEYLWKHDFVWCDDKDHNGDRIYVGKYHDVTGVNKNGFSIHRHLALRQWYGFIDSI